MPCRAQGIYKPLEEASRKRTAEQASDEASDEDEDALSAEDSGSENESQSGDESDGGSEPELVNDKATGEYDASDSDSDGSEEGGDQVWRICLPMLPCISTGRE